VGTWLTERRLAQLSVRIRVTREKLRVADEQFEALSDEASDHEMRALVSETADASFEFRQAKAHSEAMRRHRDQLSNAIREFELRQDELLDKMSAGPDEGKKK